MRKTPPAILKLSSPKTGFHEKRPANYLICLTVHSMNNMRHETPLLSLAEHPLPHPPGGLTALWLTLIPHLILPSFLLMYWRTIPCRQSDKSTLQNCASFLVFKYIRSGVTEINKSLPMFAEDRIRSNSLILQWKILRTLTGSWQKIKIRHLVFIYLNILDWMLW